VGHDGLAFERACCEFRDGGGGRFPAPRLSHIVGGTFGRSSCMGRIHCLLLLGADHGLRLRYIHSCYRGFSRHTVVIVSIRCTSPDPSSKLDPKP